jgi:hypothetical protein
MIAPERLDKNHSAKNDVPINWLARAYNKGF